MARETYVRPPLFGSEAPSNKAAIWRYRIIAILLLLLLAAAFAVAVVRVLGIGQNDPGFGDSLPAIQLVLAAR